jgi:SpoIIAA-like
MFHPDREGGAMLNVQFDGDVLAVRPDGPITREDVATLTRAADEYLADHAKIAGVMVETRAFPGFASVGAFADYARFIADHHAHVRRLALVTDSALAPVAEFMANHVVGVQMRHYPFAEGAAAQAWLRSP